MSGDLGRRGLSVRWRLTLVYTAVALASATVLVAGIYVLVSLDAGPRAVVAPMPFEQATELPPPTSTRDVTELVGNAQDAAISGTLQKLLVWSGVGLVLMMLVSLGVGWLVAGRALRPVHVVTTRAREISADSLDERLALDGPHDELREMAETFDSLLDRLQQTVESERRLVATMSHELRTPLANQRATLDVALADPSADASALRAAGEVALGEVVRAQRTIDALLALARAQSGEPGPVRPVRLDEVVGSALDDVRTGAAEDLRWAVCLEPAPVLGDPDLLHRAAVNLLQNAAVHNRPGGWVSVRLVGAAGRVTLEVVNSGEVLDARSVGALTLPFRRGAADRTGAADGTGLGLTIVQAIAEHHAADLVLDPLPDGGLRARLVLDAA